MVGETEEEHKKLSEASRYLNQILNQAPPKYTSGSVTMCAILLDSEQYEHGTNTNSGSSDTLHE